jgi:hypothetical protein
VAEILSSRPTLKEVSSLFIMATGIHKLHTD